MSATAKPKRGPGGTKLTPAERAAAKQRQADAITLHAKVDLARQGLRRYPSELADRFVTIMKQLGLASSDDTLINDVQLAAGTPLKSKPEQMAEPVLPPDDAKVPKEEPRDDGETADGKVNEGGEAEQDEKEEGGGAGDIATGYWKLSGHSVTQLQKYCCHMSPAVLSLPNLRQMVQRGRRMESRKVLLEKIEAGTGLGPDFVPRGDLRNHDTLLRFMAQRHTMRGNRLNDLPALPPVWQKHGGGGIYDFEVQLDNSVILVHVKLSLKKKLPAKHQRAIQKHSDLRIEANFSESGATLCEDAPKGISYKLICSFPDHVLPKYMDAEDGHDGDAAGASSSAIAPAPGVAKDPGCESRKRPISEVPAACSSMGPGVRLRRKTTAFGIKGELEPDKDEHQEAPPLPKAK